jgi:hypothetical protein
MTRQPEALQQGRPRTTALALTVAAFAIVALVEGHLSLQPASAQESETAEEQLAAKYAPVVHLKEQEEPCDRKGEAYQPSPVEIVLGNPEVALRTGAAAETIVSSGPSAADLFEAGEDDYLDLPGNPKKPGCTYDEAFQRLRQQYPQAITYAHITGEPGYSELALQYWFYFYFNDWNNNHESDWEMIQLVFDAASAEEALSEPPVRVAYAQHGGGETSSWDDSKVRKSGDRPVVYSARGAQGSYYSASTFFGKGEHGTGFGCDNASGPSRIVETEARLIPNEVTSASDPFAWTTYQGRWGQRESGEFNGPTGPNMKTQWTEPLSWEEGLRDSSVVVPSDTIGPNAVRWFCGAVALGSSLLFGLGPAITVGLAVGVLAAATITIRQTQFSPASATPLRKRRQFGQILGAALRLYRQHAGLFLAIGAVFVPLGLLAGVLQSIVFNLAPVEPLLDVVDNRGLSGIIALSIGLLQFGIAYWIVSVAVIAAIAALDTDRPVTLRESYRTVRLNFGPLLRARVRALLIIFLLGITVIGIPIAIYRGVRWTFIEHTMLLDGARREDALGASAAVVNGNWLRTLGIAYVVVVLGLSTGPVIGMALVLLTSTALVAVNIISSIIYVIFIPYVAIALALLYFDLKERPGR